MNFSTSDDEAVRKSAFKIFEKFSDKSQSFPGEILAGKVSSSILETCGSAEALAILFKVLKGSENWSACSENTEEEVSTVTI